MIDRFNGPYHFLSNFYECDVEVNGLVFPTSEHAYQAMKSTDRDDQKYVRDAPNPSKSKKRGRKIDLRDNWYELKPLYMEDVVTAKFEQNPDLRESLLDTGEQHLEEGNDWGDTYWGTVDGEGKNMLGKILMRVRSKLRAPEPRVV